MSVDRKYLHRMGAAFEWLFLIDVGPAPVMFPVVHRQEKESVAVDSIGFPKDNGAAVIQQSQ